MKRSTLYISVTSNEDDLLACELVMWLRESFPYTEIVGMLGPAMVSFGGEALLELSDYRGNQNSDIFMTRLVRSNLEAAVSSEAKHVLLFGLHRFHQKMVDELAAIQIPCSVILTKPMQLLSSEERAWLSDRSEHGSCAVWSSFALPSEPWVDALGVVEIGTSLAARFDKLRLTKSHLGFSASEKLITIVPPFHGEGEAPRRRFAECLEQMVGLMEQLNGDYRLCVPLCRGWDQEILAILSKGQKDAEGFHYQGVRALQAFDHHLAIQGGRVILVKDSLFELLHLSEAAVVFGDFDSICCGLFELPHLFRDLGQEKGLLLSWNCCASQEKGRDTEVIKALKGQSIDAKTLASEVQKLIKASDLKKFQKQCFKSLRGLAVPLNHMPLVEHLSEVFGKRRKVRQQKI